MASFIVLNGGALLASSLVALAAGRGRASTVLLRALGGYLALVHSITLLAGLAGRLTVGALTVLVVGALAGALWVARRESGGDEEPAGDSPRFTAATAFAPLAAVASGAVWAWPHVFEATRLWVWDDYTYHMVYPAAWLREHAIGPAPPDGAFTMQAWYPLSASVVAAWFMAPFAGERGEALAWVSLTGPLYAAIVALGTAELLARLGCRRGAWAVALLPFFTSHRVAVMASSFSDADLAHAALLFAAMAFAVPVGDHERPRDVVVDAAYAALLTGIALGIKVSAVPAALSVLAMLALRAGTLAARARVTLVVAASWATTGAYWYVRNTIHTGNPVYPAAFLWWPGATFPETTLREYARRYGLRRALDDALAVYLNWPRWHAVLAIAGLGGLACWAGWRRRSLTRSQRYFAWGMLATATAILVALPGAPYSAGNVMTFRSGFVHWDSMRYVGLLPILGWTALAFLVDGGAGARAGNAVLAILITIGSLLASGLSPPSAAPRLLALAACAVLLVNVSRRAGLASPRTRRGHAVAAGALGLALAVVVVATHAAKARATAEAFHRERLFGEAAAVLDRQPPGARVALFGDQWVYPAFGAHHHLQPIRLDGDGRAATAPIGDAMEPGDLTVDPQTFRANLRASRVDVIVVVHLEHPGRSGEWPAQQAALEAAPDARMVHRDRYTRIWQLTP